MRLSRTAVVLVVGACALGVSSVPVADATSPHTAPHIAAASPTAGPTQGRNVVMISGTHLDQVRSVSFGSVRSPKVTHVSATSLAVTAPKHASGTVTVHAGSATTRYRYTGSVRQLTWSADRVIDPVRGQFSQLSCGANGFCVGVDGAWYSGQYLVAFDGTHIVNSIRVPAAHRDLGVACAGPAYCVAFAGASASEWTGARWGAWHVVLGAKDAAGQVSCAPATTDCIALTSRSTYAVHGADWQARDLPGGGVPTSVSCAATTFCVALAPQGAFAYRGSTWEKITAPAHVDSGDLTVSCPTATFCMAFGNYGTGNVEFTAVSTFDGSAWTSLPDFEDGNVQSFSCQSPTLCVVQLYGDELSWWRGPWSDPAPVPHLAGISALSCGGGSCTVTDTNGMAVQHVGERWAAPHRVSPSSGDLADVSCASASFCMAVDAHGNAVRYADRVWSAPKLVPGARSFTAVSCVAGRMCLAVGASGSSLFRNGRWSAPQVADAGHRLTDVACPSATACHAVDSAGRALSWTGHWSAPVKVGAALTAIDCPSVRSCVAVGARSARLVNRTWHPLTNPTRDPLQVIDCVGVNWCAVAGSGGFRVLVGTTWSRAIVSEPYVDAATVACLPDRICIGSLDNSVDVWDYTFDGAESDYLDEQLYGPVLSCVAGPVCVGVSYDSAVVGRAAK